MAHLVNTMNLDGGLPYVDTLVNLLYIYISLFSSPNDKRYREDIDTIIYNIYNIYTILENRKTVS